MKFCNKKTGKLIFCAGALISSILICAGCETTVVEKPPSSGELPIAEEFPVIEEPISTSTEAGESIAALTEEEILAATRAVYDSYMALSGQTPLAPQEHEACRERMFTNMARARWSFDNPNDGTDDLWAEDFFYWLGNTYVSEEKELPYLLLPYGSTDGALADSYHGALARQFMLHPHALLRLIAVHEDKQHFCGGIAYGSYPHELELHALLYQMQADAELTQAEQEAVAHTLERMADLYCQGDESWADKQI